MEKTLTIVLKSLMIVHLPIQAKIARPILMVVGIATVQAVALFLTC